MVSLVLTWTGLVLGVSLLLVMALGPLIIQIDGYFYERKHERQVQLPITRPASFDRVTAP